MTTKNSKKGFASMPQEQRIQIASMGGIAAHEQGKAHQFNSAEAREAGIKGGRRAAEVRAARRV